MREIFSRIRGFLWKSFKIIFLILFALFFIQRVRMPGEIIFHKPGFDLVLKDATTGQPIAGAIVELTWYKGFGGSYGGWQIKQRHVMSGEDGAIKVPSITRIFFFTIFDRLAIDFYHPYYEEIQVSSLEAGYPDVEVYFQKHLRDRIRLDDGTLTISIMSFKEKYKCTDRKPGDLNNGRLSMDLGWAKRYFFILNEGGRISETAISRKIKNYQKEYVPDKKITELNLKKWVHDFFCADDSPPLWINNDYNFQ